MVPMVSTSRPLDGSDPTTLAEAVVGREASQEVVEVAASCVRDSDRSTYDADPSSRDCRISAHCGMWL